MSGLMLKLAPGERFFINGTLLENGDKPGRIRVPGPDVMVLRCRDALQPSEVNTPVKQVYYAIQLLITRDLDEVETLPAIHRACEDLSNAFEPVNPEMIPLLQEMIRRGNYYSALCYMKQIIELESQLLGDGQSGALAA
ncbi:MAG: flagellar biosynthesis repressor FlbT [Pseudomonadota bacterium]